MLEIEALVAAARAAHPRLAGDPSAFAQHLAAVGFMREHAEHVADVWLAWRCSERDPPALAELDRTQLAAVSVWVGRLDRSPAFADDVRQLLRERLLVAAGGPPRIARYDGRVALAAWLRVIAIRIAVNARRTLRPTETLASGLAAAGSPASQVGRDLVRPALIAALEAALGSLPAADAVLLRLHHLDGVTLDRLAIMHGVHRATIARRLQQARAALAAAVEARLRESLTTDAAEIRDALAFVTSQLDVSMRRLLER